MSSIVSQTSHIMINPSTFFRRLRSQHFHQYYHFRIKPAMRNALCDISFRTHMNDGNPGSGGEFRGPPTISGPKHPYLHLGFDSTKHIGNLMRLLESSHGTYFYNTVDSLSTVWHPHSQRWKNEETKLWQSTNPMQSLTEKDNPNQQQSQQSRHHHHHSASQSRLSSLHFSDDRTALIKLIGNDGHFRYIQLVRLDGDSAAIGRSGGGVTMLPNDGWTIIQEVIVDHVHPVDDDDSGFDAVSALNAIQSTLQSYLSVEHGGGEESYEEAQQLFHPNCRLWSVGIDEIDAKPTEWTGPVGKLVEIPLSTYLQGVQTQSPHDDSAKINDAIMTIDYCNWGNVGADSAAATVRVGNGAQTMVFEDHLLLGRSDNASEGWCILSKTFSSQAWPKI